MMPVVRGSAEASLSAVCVCVAVCGGARWESDRSPSARLSLTHHHDVLVALSLLTSTTEQPALVTVPGQ
eukprot:1696695-Rhodomonas_salina.2